MRAQNAFRTRVCQAGKDASTQALLWKRPKGKNPEGKTSENFAPRPVQNLVMSFFSIFSRFFECRAPCQAGATRTLWRVLLLFHRAHFVDKLGTHSESIANSKETAVKLKKTSPGVRF